jgi:hypothetical protein
MSQVRGTHSERLGESSPELLPWDIESRSNFKRPKAGFLNMPNEA